MKPYRYPVNIAAGTISLEYKGTTVRHKNFEGIRGKDDPRSLEGIIAGWVSQIKPALLRGEALDFRVTFDAGKTAEEKDYERPKCNYSNPQF